ncbi:MAG: polysaccharide deacetylase family protein [Rhodospirillaceae bacterium]|nr:polysaccharide deacetylase family protein [Rhodospirillaceae bacterium]
MTSFKWPDGARLAVSLVVNVEEGAEEMVADGDRAPDPVDELQVVMSKGRNFGNESNYRYGIKAGAPRVMRLLTQTGVKATFTAAALALERAPQLAQAIVAGGHEVCAHGYRWAHQHWMKEDMEREFIRKAAESIARTCGRRPDGWLSRYVLTENTRRLLIEEGYSYHSDDYSDDSPFWDVVDGKSIVIVPYALDTNDMKMWMAPAYTPDAWLKYACDTFDELYAESAPGDGGAPKMMSLGVHLRIIGRPGRIGQLRRFIAHALRKPGVWFATRREIAECFAVQLKAPA